MFVLSAAWEVCRAASALDICVRPHRPVVAVAARAQVSRLKNVVGSYENLRDDCKESSKVREEVTCNTWAFL
jgi:hypothetical protein